VPQPPLSFRKRGPGLRSKAGPGAGAGPPGRRACGRGAADARGAGRQATRALRDAGLLPAAGEELTAHQRAALEGDLAGLPDLPEETRAWLLVRGARRGQASGGGAAGRAPALAVTEPRAPRRAALRSRAAWRPPPARGGPGCAGVVWS